MKEITFTISIGQYNEIEVNEEVTLEEYAILKHHSDREKRFSTPDWDIDDEDDLDGMDIADCEELSDLDERVKEAAYDEMANGVYDNAEFIREHLDEEYDFDKAREYIEDHYELFVNWPELDDEEDESCP